MLLSCQHHLKRFFFFCLAVYFKWWKYFVLIDRILTKTICLRCFCVLFLNIYPKVKFAAKTLSDLWNFYSKVIFFFFFYLRKYLLLSFTDFQLLIFHNIVNISENLNKWNLLKTCLQFRYPTDFCIICSHFFTMGKVKISDFLKDNKYNKTICASVVKTNGFT